MDKEDPGERGDVAVVVVVEEEELDVEEVVGDPALM